MQHAYGVILMWPNLVLSHSPLTKPGPIALYVSIHTYIHTYIQTGALEETVTPTRTKPCEWSEYLRLRIGVILPIHISIRKYKVTVSFGNKTCAMCKQQVEKWSLSRGEWFGDDRIKFSEIWEQFTFFRMPTLQSLLKWVEKCIKVSTIQKKTGWMNCWINFYKDTPKITIRR